MDAGPGPGDQRPSVLLITNIIAHYREPIYRELTLCEDFCFHIAADPEGMGNNIKLVDPGLAEKPVEEGGLRWHFIRNRFVCGGKLMRQDGVDELAVDPRFDVIIFLGAYRTLSTWRAVRKAQKAGKRVLMWGHGFIKPTRDGKILHWLRKRFFRKADGHLFYNHFARENAIRFGFDPDTLYVVFNSLDYDRQKALRDAFTSGQRQRIREELFPNPDLPILLWIGRLTPQKKLWMILDAARALHQQGQAVNVLFIGDGQERQALEKRTRSHGLDEHVHFYGACHDEETLAPMIGACDLCAAPGEIGLTAMHALSYGTPCITHDEPEAQMPEYEAIAPGRTGIFYRHGDPDDFAVKIGQWLREAPDREKTRQECYWVIDKYYNPHRQVEIINAAVRNIPASKVEMGREIFVSDQMSLS